MHASSSSSARPRLAVVVSHAIPYYAPLYRALTSSGAVDLCVFLASRIGLDATRDPGMGVDIAWRTDLLAGYRHQLLPGWEKVKDTRFGQVDNTGIGATLAAFAPDVVLLHGYSNKTMLKTIAWCLANNVPMMMISDSSLNHASASKLAGLKNIVLPLMFRRFSAMLAIGDANQRYYETYGVPRDRIFRVPNVVDEGFWAFRQKRHSERERTRAELGLTPQDCAVLFVGKLMPRKRPGDLLAALDIIRTRTQAAGRPIKLLLAGDGELRTALEAEAAQRGLPARFLGFVNIDELPRYFCAADLLAHPAEHETFGVIVIEAAILGLPLVLSDRVGAIGPTSIARPGVNAITFPSGDAAALADALLQVAQDSALAQRLSDASLAISEELDARQSVRGTLQAIDHCLHRASQAPAT
jgi:glycosyltransferase involved in cell wall biosynthesis